MQSIIDKPNLVLTATATKSIQRDIYEHLGFKVEETKVVAALPDRYSFTKFLIFGPQNIQYAGVYYLTFTAYKQAVSNMKITKILFDIHLR